MKAVVTLGKYFGPKSQRDAITGLVFRVAQTVVNYRAKQEVEAKK